MEALQRHDAQMFPGGPVGPQGPTADEMFEKLRDVVRARREAGLDAGHVNTALYALRRGWDRGLITQDEIAYAVRDIENSSGRGATLTGDFEKP